MLYNRASPLLLSCFDKGSSIRGDCVFVGFPGVPLSVVCLPSVRRRTIIWKTFDRFSPYSPLIKTSILLPSLHTDALVKETLSQKMPAELRNKAHLKCSREPTHCGSALSGADVIDAWSSLNLSWDLYLGEMRTRQAERIQQRLLSDPQSSPSKLSSVYFIIYLFADENYSKPELFRSFR